MSAISVWIDESEIIHNGKSYWIIGQLITSSDGEELEFLRKLRVAHKDARTWDTLHACEFDESHDRRKWALLLHWINIFLGDDRVFFHSFVFERSAEWESRFPTPHDYFAHQIFFGLANKMKPQGSEMQTLFHDVDTITAIMDRRSANSGFILRQEDLPSISIVRINELETIYEERMLRTLYREISDRLVHLRFSFANSRCFDGLQLCDCLTYIVRQQLMSEMAIEANAGKREEFVNLFGEHFANGDMQTLKDFSYCRKFNYFRGN